jgi:hypothetical protein
MKVSQTYSIEEINKHTEDVILEVKDEAIRNVTEKFNKIYESINTISKAVGLLTQKDKDFLSKLQNLEVEAQQAWSTTESKFRKIEEVTKVCKPLPAHKCDKNFDVDLTPVESELNTIKKQIDKLSKEFNKKLDTQSVEAENKLEISIKRLDSRMKSISDSFVKLLQNSIPPDFSKDISLLKKSIQTVAQSLNDHIKNADGVIEEHERVSDTIRSQIYDIEKHFKVYEKNLDTHILSNNTINNAFSEQLFQMQEDLSTTKQSIDIISKVIYGLAKDLKIEIKEPKKVVKKISKQLPKKQADSTDHTIQPTKQSVLTRIFRKFFK